jgi:hypothetical protein
LLHEPGGCFRGSVSSEIRQPVVKTRTVAVQMIASMTGRRNRKVRVVLATLTVGFGTLLSTANPAAVEQVPECSAGQRLCYDTPVNAGPLINTKLFEGGPSLSQDGLTLLFGAARRNRLGVLDEDIYMATRETTAEAFGLAQNLGPTVNALGFGDYSPELSLDGLTLYFSSSRPGGQGDADLYVTTRPSIDDPWEPAQNLGPGVNSSHFDGQPSVSANGKSLYWDSDRPDGPRRLRYLDGDAGDRRRTFWTGHQRWASGQHCAPGVRTCPQPE